jgi:hypothetical protein
MTSQAEQAKAQNPLHPFIVPIAAILFIAALFITFNGGIRVGFSNHTGLLPVVRRILDSNYLPDNFGITLRLFHHRSFAYLIAAFAKLFGEDNALISLTVLGNIFLSASLFALCRSLRLTLPAYFAVGFLIATCLGWTGLGLETNTFLGNREIQPPTFAHASLLFALANLLRQRYRWTAFFAGLVLFFHLQIGFAFALILLPFFAARWKTIEVKEAVFLLALFLLPAAMTLWDVQHMLNRGLVKNPFTLADILFRQPAHFELKEPQAAVWFIAHLCVQLLVFLWLRRSAIEESKNLRPLMWISFSIAALSAIHFSDFYFLKIGSLVKFQFIRMSVMVTVLGALSFIVFLNQFAREKSNGVRLLVNLSVMILALLFYALPATRQGVPYSFAVEKYAEQNNNWVKACAWIKVNTPEDALFITPPGNDGFTYLSNRSNIVEFKINPDGAQYLNDWYERLRDVAGGVLPNEKGFANAPLLNKSFALLTQEQCYAIAKKYKATFAVLPKSSAINFQSIYENGEYRVVKLEE